MRHSRHVPALALLAAISLLFCGRAAAADAASQTFDAKGVKLRCIVEGKGEPVVLIHGLDSSVEMNWKINGVIAALAKDHRVIAFDLPGHGQSDKPEAEEAYGLQMVEDVALLMDHLDVKKAHIVGYSLGGIIAVKFLATHPDRALSGTIGGMGWLREGSALQRMWGRMPGRSGGRTPAACMQSVGKLAVSEADLKKISVPVEIIVGSRDPVKRMYVDPLRPIRPDWPLVEIDGAGHLNCIMKPQFRDALVDWIAKHTGKDAK